MLHFLLDLRAFGLEEGIFESGLPDFVEKIIPELEVSALLDEFDSVSGYALFVLIFTIIELKELDFDVEVTVFFIFIGGQTKVLFLNVGFDVESGVEAIDIVLLELLPNDTWFALNIKIGHIVEFESVEGGW